MIKASSKRRLIPVSDMEKIGKEIGIKSSVSLFYGDKSAYGLKGKDTPVIVIKKQDDEGLVASSSAALGDELSIFIHFMMRKKRSIKQKILSDFIWSGAWLVITIYAIKGLSPYSFLDLLLIMLFALVSIKTALNGFSKLKELN